MGPAYAVLSPDEFMRFMTHNGSDFVRRKEDDFMNFHVEPMEALTFKAYQEDSQHASKPLRQHVTLQCHFKIDHFLLDNMLCLEVGVAPYYARFT